MKTNKRTIALFFGLFLLTSLTALFSPYLIGKLYAVLFSIIMLECTVREFKGYLKEKEENNEQKRNDF